MKPQHGRKRVVIEDVNPQIDGGRHAIHRVSGDEVLVTAAIYADGKDELAARLHYRHSSDAQWRFAPMQAKGNDLWSGEFRVDKLGAWRFTLLGWVDHFASWAGDLKKRIAAQSDPSLTDPSQADRVLSDAAGDAATNPDAAPNSGAGLDIGSNPAVQEIAIQCSPDHPWVAEHSDWIVHRPDGSIQYAENPPKIYQDIYPLDFESVGWRGLWGEFCPVLESRIERGVRAFRVDNPHTKPDFSNATLVMVSLDSFNEQTGWTNLDLDKLGCSEHESFLVDDLLSGAQYIWRDRNYVALRPGVQRAHILRVSRMQ